MKSIKMNLKRLTIISLLLLAVCSTIAQEASKYLDQKPPGLTAEKFAPGLISLDTEYEFGSVFNKAGTEFYYGVDTGNGNEIRFSEYKNGKWTTPKVIPPGRSFSMNDPFLSPDENRLYFISGQESGYGNYDIWYVERRGSGWSEPINAGPNINSRHNEYYISFTVDGTMYFSSNKLDEGQDQQHFDIFYSEFKSGEFQPAVRLGDAINTNHYEADVFIDPNEQYIIFCANRPGGLGRGDLYISFKLEDGSWTRSINMGDRINTTGHELCPFVTADGKYFLYTSNQDIYWISTEVFSLIRARK